MIFIYLFVCLLFLFNGRHSYAYYYKYLNTYLSQLNNSERDTEQEIICSDPVGIIVSQMWQKF